LNIFVGGVITEIEVLGLLQNSKAATNAGKHYWQYKHQYYFSKYCNTKAFF